MTKAELIAAPVYAPLAAIYYRNDDPNGFGVIINDPHKQQALADLVHDKMLPLYRKRAKSVREQRVLLAQLDNAKRSGWTADLEHIAFLAANLIYLIEVGMLTSDEYTGPVYLTEVVS